MLNLKDLAELLSTTREDVATKVVKGILPEPVEIRKGVFRWRIEDVDATLDWWRERARFQQNGGDPDSESGPQPPLMSTGEPLFDPRSAKRRIDEKARRGKTQRLRQIRQERLNKEAISQ